MYDITKIRNNLSMSIDAVNGMMSALDDAEKNAWAVIYNSRVKAVFDELGIIAKLEMPVEPEPMTEAPVEQPVAEPESVPEVPVEGTTFTE